MKQMFRNRKVLGIACIILSLVICFGLTPLFNDSISSKIKVVRVSSDISKGEMITSKKIEIVEVGGHNMLDETLKNKDEIIGKYAKADLYKGDYILQKKLSDDPLANYEYLYNFNENERAISVSIKSFAAGFSGKLESGDIISVIVSNYGKEKVTISPLELLYVEMLAVTTNEGIDTEEYDDEEEKSERKNLPATITLKVSPEQAILLANYEATGNIHIIFVHRGDAKTSEKFLNLQDEILLNILINENKNDDNYIEEGEFGYE